MSNYCGLCNGHLNGPPCHENLEGAEAEVKALRRFVTSVAPMIEYLAADCVTERECTNERVYMQGVARAWLKAAKGVYETPPHS